MAHSIGIVLIATAAACPADYPDRVPPGSWGGQHIGMVVSDTGAVIEYDCASGVVAGPLTLGAQGEFDWSGTHIRGHGGPSRIDETPDAHPARYAGKATSNQMTLTLTVTDGSQPPQTFSLTRGANAGVFKCL